MSFDLFQILTAGLGGLAVGLMLGAWAIMGLLIREM